MPTPTPVVDPFELLAAHRITTSMIEPRHNCSCGAVFHIDIDSENPYQASGAHIGEVMDAAAEAARVLLALADERGVELPPSARELLNELARPVPDHG